MINFAVNRIDLKFWASMQYYGNNFEMISKNLELKNMNIIYNGYSLYHYFVENQNIMQFICNMYQNQKDEKSLAKEEYFTPLCLLVPDKEGSTALDLALKL